MGVVYRGVDLTLKRPVAIKAMLGNTADATHLARFMHEARALASVEHSGLVPVYAVGQEGGVYYMVMKFVEGRPLSEVIESEGRIDEGRVRDILIQVCSALSALHGQGLVHRDIKPANLMVGIDGQVTVMDLGIVKSIGDDAEGMVAATMGTPRYMPPEMFSNAEVDGRADLYSLSIIAYYALSGEVPFDGPTPMGILYKQAHEPVPSLRSAAPWVSTPMAALVEACLAKEPDERPANALAYASRVRALGVKSSAGPRLAALGLIILGGAVAAYITLQPSAPTPPVVDAAPPVVVDAAPVPDAAVVDAAPIPDAAPVIKTTLRIVSTPSGASVYERGRRIGRTPLTVRRPKGTTTLGLTLKLAEHGDEKISASLERDEVIRVTLKPMFEVLDD